MKMPKNRLWLHTELSGLVDTLGSMEDAKFEANQDDPSIDFTMLVIKQMLPTATVFDCRPLPLEFVIDTGESIAEEPQEVRGPVRIPFQSCYFEFEDKISVLCVAAEYMEDENGNEMPMFAPPIRLYGFQGNENAQWIADGAFENQSDRPMFTVTSSKNADSIRMSDRACKLVLGVLGLLKEKFLTEIIEPDPMPRLTKVRAKKGKHPISSETRVLTVNVAAVRRAVSKSAPSRQHESPALHWRRGHSRVLHRGSEFESQTWVKRCLVGDPARGYSSKDYRLIWSPVMVKPNAAPAPTTSV
jgi:hypothetical protein